MKDTSALRGGSVVADQKKKFQGFHIVQLNIQMLGKKEKREGGKGRREGKDTAYLGESPSTCYITR